MIPKRWSLNQMWWINPRFVMARSGSTNSVRWLENVLVLVTARMQAVWPTTDCVRLRWHLFNIVSDIHLKKIFKRKLRCNLLEWVALLSESCELFANISDEIFKCLSLFVWYNLLMEWFGKMVNLFLASADQQCSDLMSWLHF